MNALVFQSVTSLRFRNRSSNCNVVPRGFIQLIQYNSLGRLQTVRLGSRNARWRTRCCDDDSRARSTVTSRSWQERRESCIAFDSFPPYADSLSHPSPWLSSALSRYGVLNLIFRFLCKGSSYAPSRCKLAVVFSLLTFGVAGAEPPKPRQSTLEATDAEWPEFRGPTGQGHSPAVGLPITWSETENIAWKVAILGRGLSSPVINREQIWLTAADDDRKTLRALCLDRNTGSVRHNVVVNTLAEAGMPHVKNSLASPTPLLEGDRVYVHFGPHGTACLSTAGKILWQTVLPHKQSYDTQEWKKLAELCNQGVCRELGNGGGNVRGGK